MYKYNLLIYSCGIPGFIIDKSVTLLSKLASNVYFFYLSDSLIIFYVIVLGFNFSFSVSNTVNVDGHSIYYEPNSQLNYML